MNFGLKLITFDFLGTLGHFKGSPVDHYDIVLKNSGIEIDREILAKSFKEALSENTQSLPNYGYAKTTTISWWTSVVTSTIDYAIRYQKSNLEILPEKKNRIARELFLRFSGNKAYQLYPDTEIVLHELRKDFKGLKIAIISNTDERLHTILESLKINSLVDLIITSKELGYEKPHPNIFHAALKSFNIEAEEAIHVGNDLVKDFEGASDAGLHSILVKRDGKDGDKIGSTTNVIKTLKQLPEWLRKWERTSANFFTY